MSNHRRLLDWDDVIDAELLSSITAHDLKYLTGPKLIVSDVDRSRLAVIIPMDEYMEFQKRYLELTKKANELAVRWSEFLLSPETTEAK